VGTSLPPLDALESLGEAADALYRTPLGEPALDALERADYAVRVLRSTGDDAELAKAQEEIERARSLVASAREPEVRAAANRLYGSAVILLEPRAPWQRTHLMLLRVTLREVVVAAETGSALAARRPALVASAACRSLGLDAAVAASAGHGPLQRKLAEIDDEIRADRTEGLVDAAWSASTLLDQLEAELAAGGELAASGAKAHGAPAPPRDGSPNDVS
jgi:hypothetical protein